MKLPGYQLLHNNPDHFVVKHEKSGHELRVAKHMLSPTVHAKITAMPIVKAPGTPKVQKFADGDEVKAPDANAPAPTPAPDPGTQGDDTPPVAPGQDVSIALPGGATPPMPATTLNKQATPATGEDIPEPTTADFSAEKASKLADQYGISQKDAADLLANTPNAASRSPAGGGPVTVVKPEDRVGTPPPGGKNPFDLYTSTLMESLSGQSKAAQAAQDAIAKGQADAAKAQKALQNTLITAQNNHASEIARLNQKDDTLFQAASTGKVDPNRYWNNMSTAGKIGSSIALALGGLAGGLNKTGQNVALTSINNAIDRDIDAQKANINQNNNLYNMNLSRLRNENQAYTETKVDALTLAQAKVAQAVATSGSEQAKAQGQMLMAQMGQQKAALQYQLGTSNATAANGPSPDSVRMAITTGMIPQAQQKDAVKELGEYDKVKNALDNTDKVFDIALNNATYSQRALPAWVPTIRDKSKIYQGVTDAWLNNIAREVDGRVTPTEIDQMRHSLPQAGDTPEVRSAKIGEIKNLIRSKFSFPTLEMGRVIPPNFQAQSSNARSPLSTWSSISKPQGGGQ
jgi:hypothetical protein